MGTISPSGREPFCPVTGTHGSTPHSPLFVSSLFFPLIARDAAHVSDGVDVFTVKNRCLFFPRYSITSSRAVESKILCEYARPFFFFIAPLQRGSFLFFPSVSLQRTPPSPFFHGAARGSASPHVVLLSFFSQNPKNPKKAPLAPQKGLKAFFFFLARGFMRGQSPSLIGDSVFRWFSSRFFFPPRGLDSFSIFPRLSLNNCLSRPAERGRSLAG